MALPEESSQFKPARPGGTLFDFRKIVMPAPGLLHSSTRTEALSKVPELQGNLSEFAQRLPTKFTGLGQGVFFEVDPELDVMSSRLRPFLGRYGDPALVDQITKAHSDIVTRMPSLPPAKLRSLREEDRLVRAVHSQLRSFNPDDLGVIIKMGLARPAAVPLNVRDAYVMAAYLLSGAGVPESATMDLGSHWGQRATARHSVRLGIESGREGYFLGSGRAEVARRIEETLGTKGTTNMMATMGMQQPRNAPLGTFFQEQMLSPMTVERRTAEGVVTGQKVFNPFEKRLRDIVERSAVRANQEWARIERSGNDPKKLLKLGNQWRTSLTDFIEEIVKGSIPARAGDIVPRNLPMLDRKGIDDFVTQAFQKAGTGPVGKVPDLGSKEHLIKTVAVLQAQLNQMMESKGFGALESRIGATAFGDLKERLGRVRKEFFGEFAKSQTGLVREVAGLKEGSKKIGREISRTGQALVKGETGMMRVPEPIRKAIARAGRSAPKSVPMFLVSALAAGMLALGITRSEEAEA